MARLIRGQALNHFAQSRQGQIDTFALRESMARIGANSCNSLQVQMKMRWEADFCCLDTCFPMPLATGQVN